MKKTIKIGRFEYDIVKGDKFMDNGACVQLLTQSKEYEKWGNPPPPKLSKKTWKEVLAMPSFKKYPYDETGVVFIYEILEV